MDSFSERRSERYERVVGTQEVKWFSRNVIKCCGSMSIKQDINFYLPGRASEGLGSQALV